MDEWQPKKQNMNTTILSTPRPPRSLWSRLYTKVEGGSGEVADVNSPTTKRCLHVLVFGFPARTVMI